MKQMYTAVITMMLAGLLVVACRPAPQPPSPLEPAPVGDAGIRDAASLEQRLKAAGVTLTLDSELPTHYLPGTARIYAVQGGAERVEVYQYKDAAEAAKVAAGISPDGRSMVDPQDPAATVAVEWPAPPHVFLRGPILVIYAGDDQAALNALSAGLGDAIAGVD